MCQRCWGRQRCCCVIYFNCGKCCSLFSSWLYCSARCITSAVVTMSGHALSHDTVATEYVMLACLLASSSFSFMNAFIHAFIFHASFHSLIHSLVDVLAVTYGKQGCLQIIVWNIICGSLFLSGQTWDCAFVKFQSKLMFCC